MADFDVIVVGSGMSGGWVAKELCEQGFKVCVIERGRELDPVEDYTDMMDPWQMEHLNMTGPALRERYPVMADYYAFHSYTKQFWADEIDHPYETAEGTDYAWRRGYHVGGRSIMWARQSYRMSEIDFAANAKDGVAPDWPVRYADLSPWYDKVESFIGVSGNDDGIEVLPSGGVYQPPHAMTAGELYFKAKVEERWPTRKVIIGRAANLTQPTEEQLALGRGQCQARNHCFRGCSFGAYFSSNSATLPAAEKTGNLTLMADTAVHEVVYDPETNRATGVRGVNTRTREPVEVTGRAIFLNASTINTALILLNSKSDTMPNGLANSSGHVGRNLHGHAGKALAGGVLAGFEDIHHYGRRPNGFYIPRYRNHLEPGDGYLRGYGYQGQVTRTSWRGRIDQAGIGSAFKDRVRQPGAYSAFLVSFSEMLPRFENHVRPHATRRDKWGSPVPVLDVKNSENEIMSVRQAARDAVEMLEVAGATDIWSNNTPDLMPYAPGDGIHEMGTCRMGADPTTSVLNRWNQSHDVPNLFATDGSFMASSACQNPSLTYMAFSARAANHAAELLKEGVI